jgi:hypothetical protein
MKKFYVHLVTECRYFSGGLIELKCAIRGSFGILGPRVIKKKEGCICLLPVLRTPACSLTIVTPYRYFGSVKKKNECELILLLRDTECRFTDRHREEILVGTVGKIHSCSAENQKQPCNFRASGMQKRVSTFINLAPQAE